MCEESITRLLGNLREGVDVSHAQTVIWDHFFDRLTALANKRLGQRVRRVADGEDVALDALDEFFRKIRGSNNFPQLSNRESLWPLLAKIASRKAINEFKHANAKKRGGGKVRGESVFVDLDSSNPNDGIDQIEKNLTPEFADELFLGIGEVLTELGRYDQKLLEVAILRLRGFSTSEIAERLGYKNSKTIERHIKQIRIFWKSFQDGLAKIKIFYESTLKLELDIADEPTILGRQRQGEPPPFWFGLSDMNGKSVRRVIIAESNQKTVSRNHLTIRIRDEDWIEVENSSLKSKLVLNGEVILEPSQRWSSSENCSIMVDVGLEIAVRLTAMD